MIAPSTMSQMWANDTVSSANSSAMMLSVAPAALPMPSARWPALRPIATTTYQRRVALASSIRLRTSSTPTCRAVWKPKVGMCGGSGRSLSIVFGTWTLLIVPCERSLTVRDESAVSSPPMVTRCVMPACCSVSMTACSASGDLVGFSREVPSTDPPVRCTRDTSSMASGRSFSSVAPDQVLEAVLDPDDLEALVDRLDRRRRDDGVDAGSGTSPDENAEPSSLRSWMPGFFPRPAIVSTESAAVT